MSTSEQSQAYNIANLKRYSDVAVNNLVNRRDDIYRDFFAGGLAGALSRTAVSPFERLKLLFMCGGERVRQCGVLQGLRNIYSHEGFRGYFRGNLANVARIYPFTAIQLSSYPFFKSVMTLGDDANMTVGIRFWSGVFAGFLATFFTYPMDFIRCRLSMQTEKHALYRGLVDGILKVSQQEGFMRLYTGIFPSLLGIIPYAGFQLSTYDLTRNYLVRKMELEQPTKLVTFVSGSFAGLVAQTAAFPIEMVRRRMQVRGFQLGGIVDPNAVRLDKEPTFLREFRAVLREGGVKGLYRGIVPNYIKIVPAAGINFIVYEYARAAWSEWHGTGDKKL